MEIVQKIPCKICGNDYVPNSHYHKKTGTCSKECRIINQRRIRDKHKQTDKWKISKGRWIKSKRRNQNEKIYRSKPKARSLAVIRAKRHLTNCIDCLNRKRARDKLFSRSIKGRQYNNKSKQKYRKTEKGRWQAKTYKYLLRHNLAGKIDKKAWEDKLKQLEGKCQICGIIENITIDHIIPLSKGGTNLIDNLQPLCRSCNCTKNNKIYENNL